MKRIKFWLTVSVVIIASLVAAAVLSRFPPQTPTRNAAPSFTYNVSNSTFTFTAIGGLANYAWDFGDGSTATGPKVSHTYNSNGNYTVTLTATPEGGSSESLSTYQLVLVNTVTSIVHNYFVNLNVSVGNAAS